MVNNPLKTRLLTDNIKNPYKHFAVEEAILRLVEEDISPPTLRIRRIYPSVWVGVYQYVEEDVDVDYCQKNNIPIVRRPNPGGSVYQDNGSFCFSLFFKTKEMLSHLGINDPSELYKILGLAIIDTCAEFDVQATLSGINDITVNKRKIYGSAQLELYSAFVHSGTFLFNVNIDEMVKTLKPSKLKFIDKGYTDIRSRVKNFVELINKDKITINNVIQVLIKKIAKRLNLRFYKDTFLMIEKSLIEQLFINKYSKKEWTFREKEKIDVNISRKAKSGIIVLYISLKENLIEKIALSGDFLIPNRDYLKIFLSKLKFINIDEAILKVKVSFLPDDIKETLTLLLQEVRSKNL